MHLTFMMQTSTMTPKFQIPMPVLNLHMPTRNLNFWSPKLNIWSVPFKLGLLRSVLVKVITFYCFSKKNYNNNNNSWSHSRVFFLLHIPHPNIIYHGTLEMLPRIWLFPKPPLRIPRSKIPSSPSWIKAVSLLSVIISSFFVFLCYVKYGNQNQLNKM